jgi:hypothetical protein
MTKPKRRFVIDPRGKRIEVEQVPIPGIERKARPSGGQRFAMLTTERLKLLARTHTAAAVVIYCYLLVVNWKKLRQPVKLTNAVLTEIGVSRHAKSRALPQLERVGLVKVERLGHEAPIVTPLK